MFQRCIQPIRCGCIGHTKKMQSCAVPCCVPNAGTAGSCCQLGRAPGPHPNGTLAVPNEVQLAWQDLEVGALNSYQMVTFWGGQLKADRPFNLTSPAAFTAKNMDTDQWAQAVAAMGGKYQVLNVKDESGFLLWPTKCAYQNGTAYPYTVANSPNAKANGDLLERFVASNKKHGIRSGIYYLGWGNFFMNITNSGATYDCSIDTPQTREFIHMQLCHLEELYSQYDFSEIWFDGGAPCLKSYEDAIANLTVFYQGKRAVAFQGPTSYPNDIRWVGTEAGVAPPDTWSATASSQSYGAGIKNGQVCRDAPQQLLHLSSIVDCLLELRESFHSSTRRIPGETYTSLNYSSFVCSSPAGMGPCRERHVHPDRGLLRPRRRAVGLRLGWLLGVVPEYDRVGEKRGDSARLLPKDSRAELKSTSEHFPQHRR